jgi:hypothetical protein
MDLCSHLDPNEAIGMRGAHEHNRLKIVATQTNGGVLVVAGSGKMGC